MNSHTFSSLYEKPDGAVGVKQYVMDQVKLLREELSHKVELMGVKLEDQIRKLDVNLKLIETNVKVGLHLF